MISPGSKSVPRTVGVSGGFGVEGGVGVAVGSGVAVAVGFGFELVEGLELGVGDEVAAVAPSDPGSAPIERSAPTAQAASSLTTPSRRPDRRGASGGADGARMRSSLIGTTVIQGCDEPRVAASLIAL